MKCDEVGISWNFILPLDRSVEDGKLHVSEIKKKTNFLIITTKILIISIMCILKRFLMEKKKINVYSNRISKYEPAEQRYREHRLGKTKDQLITRSIPGLLPMAMTDHVKFLLLILTGT